MQAVEVGNGRRIPFLVRAQVVRVQDGEEADGDARDGQDVKHGVQQLVPDATTAAARAVHQHSCGVKGRVTYCKNIRAVYSVRSATVKTLTSCSSLTSSP